MKRATYFRLHSTAGLALAVLALLSAVTGSVLVFRSDLKAQPPSAPAVKDPIALEAIAAAAVASGNGAPATDIGLPNGPGEPYKVWLDDDDETVVFLDGRGRVLESRAEAHGFTRWLFRLHTGDTLGPMGTLLTLVTGLGIAALVWSGLSMLWARRRARGGRARTTRADPSAP